MRLQYATPNPSFLNSMPTLVNFSEKDDMKIFSSSGSASAPGSGDGKDAKGAAASVGGTVGKGLSPTDILWRVKCDFAQVRPTPSSRSSAGRQKLMQESQGRPIPELLSFLYRAKALYQVFLPTSGKEKFRSVAWASDSGFVGNYEFLSAKVWEKLGEFSSSFPLLPPLAVLCLVSLGAIESCDGRNADGSIATGSRNLSRLRENNALKSLGSTPSERGKNWDVKLAVHSSRAPRVSLFFLPSISRSSIELRGVARDEALTVAREQMAKSNRVEAALKIMFQLVDTTYRRKGMGVLELRGWVGIVWDVLRINAERSCVLLVFRSPLILGAPPSCGMLTILLHVIRGHGTILAYIDRATPPRPNHHNLSPPSTPPPLHSTIADHLAQGVHLLSITQPTTALPHFLKAHHLATGISDEISVLRSMLGIIQVRLAVSPTVEEALRSERELDVCWTRFLLLGIEFFDRSAEGAGDWGEEIGVLAKALEVRARAVLIRVKGDDEGVRFAVADLVKAGTSESSHLPFRAMLICATSQSIERSDRQNQR